MPGALGVLGLLFPELMKTVINVIRAKCHVHTKKRLKDCGKVLRGNQGEHSQPPSCWDFDGGSTFINLKNQP